jgi:hypothetical protein
MRKSPKPERRKTPWLEMRKQKMRMLTMYGEMLNPFTFLR